LQKLFNSGGQQRPVHRLNGKVFAQIEQRALLDLRSDTHGFNDPIGIGIVTMIRCFRFGSSNIHGSSMGENPKKSNT
jgi:hypothetical protein